MGSSGQWAGAKRGDGETSSKAEGGCRRRHRYEMRSTVRRGREVLRMY